MANDPKRSLFRKQALDRLSSPERLDQLIHIIDPQDWLPLGTLGILVLLGLMWSIFGRLPMTINGKGILLFPHQIVTIQSPISGQLKQLKIKVGDCIKKDNGDDINDPKEIIAIIDPLELKQQLRQQELKLTELENQDIQATAIELQKTELEQVTLQQQKKSLEQRLRDTQILNPIIKNQRNNLLQQKRANLQQRFKDAEAIAPIFKGRLETRKKLFELGAISKDQVLEAQQQYQKSLQDISTIKAEFKQLNVEETEIEQKFINNRNSILELQDQLQELNTKIATLEQQNLQASTNRKNKLLEVKQNIELLKQQIKSKSQITTQHTGCILELTTTVGDIVNPGTNLASIQVAEQTSKQLEGIIYFAVGDGKQIKPEMEILITPTTVQRERFGGIVGTVTAVSPFPITKEGAINLVGNQEIVESLIGQTQEPQIEVRVKLQPNPSTFSGYDWSTSQGPPNLKISSGTTTTARITIEQRAPITFILPFLRELSGK